MEIKERTGKEKSTLARYQDMLDSRINPYLGKTPVDEITGDMLDDFYAMLLKPGQNKKTGGGLSRKTVLEHHHVISTIMEHAIRKHLIAFNPCRDATPPVADPPMPNYYQPADLTLIRQALENESVKWYTLIHVLMLYGIRYTFHFTFSFVFVCLSNLCACIGCVSAYSNWIIFFAYEFVNRFLCKRLQFGECYKFTC